MENVVKNVEGENVDVEGKRGGKTEGKRGKNPVAVTQRNVPNNQMK